MRNVRPRHPREGGIQVCIQTALRAYLVLTTTPVRSTVPAVSR